MSDFYEYLDHEEIEEEESPEKNRSRRVRRKNTWKKIRKVENLAARHSTGDKVDARFLGHRASKVNPLKYYGYHKRYGINNIRDEQAAKQALSDERTFVG